MAPHATTAISAPLTTVVRAEYANQELRTRLTVPASNPEQALYASAPLPQTGRIMVKDENLCVHCGLCAERCPTAAWDMQKSDILLPYALTALPMAQAVPSR